MGYMQASEMNDALPRRVALEWHLQYNHYPPVPLSMVDACELAIEAMQDEDYERQIDLPAGSYYRGEESAPAWAIAQAHHLDAFIDNG
jgi:hypothetical protein